MKHTIPPQRSVKPPVPSRRTVLEALAAVAVLPAVGCAGAVKPGSERPVLTVYLARHAEKEKGVKDPGLTAVGTARALSLADRLSDADLSYIHSTDYKRTQATATPVSQKFNLPAETYNPRDLSGFAAHLKHVGRTHLVVGHSNTTPELFKHLSGEDFGPLSDDEYHWLYVVTCFADGRCTGRREPYGQGA